MEEILKILAQIGEALQYAHQKNIIHRDLKPENILFNARSDALLADFGLATMLATASIKYMSNAGTPRYMSPEQFQGMVSKESDQYALGCIAYELWTGHPLFNAPDPVALMYKHVPIKLKVIPFNGKKQAKLGVNPGTLNFGNLAVGQRAPSLITVGNTGTLGLNWTADTGNVSWLSVSPGSGTIQSGGFPQTIKVVANTANINMGNYSAVVNIHSNGGSAQVGVALAVSSPPQGGTPTQPTVTQPAVTQPPITAGPTHVPPQFNVSPPNVSFSNVPTNTTRSQQLTITNSGGQPLNWSANTNANWLSLDTNNGTINQGNSQSINLTGNTQGLSGGQTYSGTVSFTSNGGSFNLSVSLSTVANPAVLSVDQSSVNASNDCTFTPGASNATWTCNYTLRNAQNASSSLNWTASSW